MPTPFKLRRTASFRLLVLSLWLLPLGAGCAHAAPKLTAAPQLAGAPTLPLGAGLNGEIDWVRDEAFADMVKTTRGFQTFASGEPAPKTDGSGWPTEDFFVILSDNGAAITPGVYHVSFVGPRTTRLTVFGSSSTVGKPSFDAATGTNSYEVVVPDGVTFFRLDFHATQGQVKQLRVIRPGYDALHPPLFSEEYLALIKARRPNVLRFMDWHATNGNLEREWADRSLPTDATQTARISQRIKVNWDKEPHLFENQKGICWEYCVALANQTNCDLWLNVPVMASDDYVQHLAALVKAQLKPGLRVWVEYSNEVWNDSFLQAGMNRDAAVEEVKGQGNSNLAYDGDKGDVTVGDRRYARRALEVGQMFVRAFGPGSFGARVKPVLAYQLVPYRFANQLAYIRKNYGPPSSYFAALAVAPYFACGNGQGADARTDLRKDDVLNALQASVDHYKTGTTLDEIATLATKYGLKMAAYEGGPDTFGANNIAAKKAASLDPRMKDIMVDYLRMWSSKGGDQFNWFVIGAGKFESPYGTWSITDNLRDLAQPKELGFDAARQMPRAPLAIGQAVPGEVDARIYPGRPKPLERVAFLGYFSKGAQLDYLLRAPRAGNYRLQISAATLKNAPKTIGFSVNDGPLQTVNVPATANENTFADSAPALLALAAGLNTLTLTVPDERPYNLNSLKITNADGSGIANALPTTDFTSYGEHLKVGELWKSSFNVADDSTPPDALRVSATSDNPTLFPAASIKVESGHFERWGLPCTRQISLSPAPGQTGKARLTLAVEDAQGLKRVVEFDIEVK